MIEMIRNNSYNNIHVTKLSILDDMTVLITDISLDTNYLKIYVPADDRIRNKGKLTLISPKYAFTFAQILTIITKETTVDTANPIFTKPDKDKIKNKIFCTQNNIDQDHVKRLMNKL